MTTLNPHDIAALEALDTAWRACLNATDRALYSEAGTYGLTENVLRHALAALLGDQRADGLIQDLRTTDRPFRKALDIILAVPQCYVVHNDFDGLLGVYAHKGDADAAAENDDYVTQTSYTAARLPELPENLDLDMVAYDIADILGKGDYGLGDITQNEIRAELPAFLAAALTRAQNT